MGPRSVYFTDKELRCKCGCGLNRMEPEFLSLLDSVRAKYGKPLGLTSAMRCEKHNKNVGGAKNSAHLFGRAADISIQGGRMRRSVARTADELCIVRIGLANTFVHIDNDPYLPQDVWWIY